MSELQISLLVIGIAIVLAIYLYSGWQQYRYRRRFSATFKPRHEDVLYQQPVEKSAPEATPPQQNPENDLPAGNEDCTLLNAATDYIATLSLDHPANGSALAQLWQQRFDFGKSIHICGLNANGAWEKVAVESRVLYSSFKLALQLVNRSGAVSEVALADFRDMARMIATQLQAAIVLPDVAQAAERAKELDKFCAGVDLVIVLNLLRGSETSLPGGEVARAAEKHGFSLQADGSFHLFDGHGHALFSLGNADNTPFQHHTIAQSQVRGLTLLLDVPRATQPVLRFDQMVTMARQLAGDLHATVVDDRHAALSESGIKLIREQIAAVEATMLAGHIVPGSLQACRLFS